MTKLRTIHFFIINATEYGHTKFMQLWCRPIWSYLSLGDDYYRNIHVLHMISEHLVHVLGALHVTYITNHKLKHGFTIQYLQLSYKNKKSIL